MFARFIFFTLAIIAFFIFAILLVNDIGLNNKKLKKKERKEKKSGK